VSFLLFGLATGGTTAVITGIIWLLLVPAWLRSALRDRRLLADK
jgi:hypothetical protein